ncbi:S9 family peptidase [Halioglobus pacificus]|uniref:Peptidase S9 n=1 Tax=Parahalioglobus pacificus TaxID=930806 RepID=A0A919CHY8_9GAMM|nr:S9 family peptidase [Halioglobus pacificus]GHD27325.1 peptidase S9 [Halioglobus pacificus]
MLNQRSALAGLIAAIAILVAACTSAPPEQEIATTPEIELIDRQILFGNPTRFQGRLSPNGEMMSFRAPLDGVMNIWVAPAGDINAARPVTRNTGRGVPSHFWALDSESVLYIEDQNGDENFHLYRINLATNQIKDLTPYPGVRAEVIAQSEDHPGVVIVGMNDRDQRWHDIYRVDLQSGKRELLLQNEGFSAVYVDNDLQVRLAQEQTESGGANLYTREGEDWEPLMEIAAEDYYTTGIVGFGADNNSFYALDSRGRDTGALVRINIETGEANTLAMSDNADISDALIHPRTHELIAVAATIHQRQWEVQDGRYIRDFQILQDAAGGDVDILSTTLDGEKWTVYVGASDAAARYAVYDRDTQTLTDLFTTYEDLEGLPLAAKRNVFIESRDGKNLVSYLTLPLGTDPDGNGRPEQPVPMVLLVHGGPWARDGAGYSPTVQWLANRGYAVLQVNFRGSTGFGKAFTNAGNLEWAGKMHDDLIDAVEWATKRRITRKSQVAIMGGSYGGYATLVGLTFTPDTFACGVDIVGPSNLNTLLASIPPYWEGFRRTLIAAVGDPETPEGAALLNERSPINYVDAISKPLLIGQGANDPRVKQAESDQIVEAMQGKGIPVTYVLFPDEGHGFQKPENNMAFNAITESFLAQCLGGRSQPIGNAFTASSLKVMAGSGEVPGVSEALLGSQ